MSLKKWNWQQDDWPSFSYDYNKLEPLELEYAQKAGLSVGVITHLSEKDKEEVTLELVGNEALKTSEIEGEILDRDSLQSSLCKEFKIGERFLWGSIEPREAGIAMMLKDLYTNFDSPLSHKLLHDWHEKLTNGRLDIERGAYRSTEDAMRVVSGKIDKPKVHFEAPPSSAVPKEMDNFIEWFNNSAPGEKMSLPPLTRAGLAHLYLISIHPFEDGNGRIGRALVEKSLSQNLGQPTLVALSSTITDKKNDYYTTLESQNKTNQVTPWLSYFGKTIIAAQLKTVKQVEFTISKAKFFDAYKRELNSRQTRAIVRILKEGINGWQGGFSAKNYASINKTSAATATRDLKDLVEKGIFSKTGKLKSTRYTLELEKAVERKRGLSQT